MRSCLLQFEGRSCLVSRAVLAFCLAVTLFVTPFLSASSTQATVASRTHTKRLSSSHAKPSRRQAELRRLAVERQRQARNHRRRKTYARSHRLSVTLDQVHSHAAIIAETTPPAAASATRACNLGKRPRRSLGRQHLSLAQHAAIQYFSPQLHAGRFARLP